jgi:hypothetical protein
VFASLTKIYTHSLANGEMTCIDDALTQIAKQENEIAIKQAVGICKQQIESLGIPLPDDFEQQYKQIQRDALGYFRKKAKLDDLKEFEKKAEVKFSFKSSLFSELSKRSFLNIKSKHVSSYCLIILVD